MFDNDFKKEEQLKAVSEPLPTALQELDEVIQKVVSHISDFTKNKSDFTRNRKLNAEDTVKTTLNMAGQSINTELIKAFPDIDDRMTVSAYEQQKAKLTLELMLHIFHEYNKTDDNYDLFEGKYELYAIDGTDFSIPYQRNSKYAMESSPGRNRKDGEPKKQSSVLHANLVNNLTAKTYEDIVIQPKSETDERSAAIQMLKRLKPKNPYIVLLDRGYDGFNMTEHGNRLNGNGYYVLRTKTGEGGIKEIRDLPDEECDVDMVFRVTTSSHYKRTHPEENYHLINRIKHQHKKYLSPNTKNQRWDFEDYVEIKTRAVKFQINDPDSGKPEWEVLLTSLSREEFPVWKMKKLYFRRWGIETSFRDLKYSLGAIQFHSRKDDFIEMELISHLIMYNAVSRIMRNTEVPKSENRKYEYAVSFKDAVTLVRKYFRIKCKDDPFGIYAELQKYIVPIQPGRKDKRRLKPKSAVSFMYRVT